MHPGYAGTQDALSVRPHDTFKFELEVLIRVRKGQQRILLRAATKLDFDYWSVL